MTRRELDELKELLATKNAAREQFIAASRGTDHHAKELALDNFDVAAGRFKAALMFHSADLIRFADQALA